MSSTLTTKYQNALPYALLSTSPGLAALHAIRYRLLHPQQVGSLNSAHCSRCGTFGIGIRVCRSGKARVLRKTCRACGFQHDIAADPGNAAEYLRRKTKGNRFALGLHTTHVSGEMTDSTSSIQTISKPQPKKRHGLQNMLARNREMEEQAKKSSSDSAGGLAMFLSGI